MGEGEIWRFRDHFLQTATAWGKTSTITVVTATVENSRSSWDSENYSPNVPNESKWDLKAPALLAKIQKCSKKTGSRIITIYKNGKLEEQSKTRQTIALV